MPNPTHFKNYQRVKPQDPFPGGGKVALLIDGKDCGNRVRAELVELQEGEAFPLHIHPKSDHVIIVVGGEGHLQWEVDKREITTGDTFVVPMGEIHSIKAGDKSPLRFMVVNVPPVDFDNEHFMQPVDPKSAAD